MIACYVCQRRTTTPGHTICDVCMTTKSVNTMRRQINERKDINAMTFNAGDRVRLTDFTGDRDTRFVIVAIDDGVAWIERESGFMETPNTFQRAMRGRLVKTKHLELVGPSLRSFQIPVDVAHRIALRYGTAHKGLGVDTDDLVILRDALFEGLTVRD